MFNNVIAYGWTFSFLIAVHLSTTNYFEFFRSIRMDAIKDLKQCSFLKLHGLCIDIFNIVVGALFSKIGGIYSLIGASLIIRNVASIIYTVLQYHGKTSRLLLFFVISCLVLLACLGKCSSTYNRFGSCFLFNR